MTIKKINTLSYEIELLQTPKGYYQVVYSLRNSGLIKTRPTLDFNLANSTFSSYLTELVGQ